MSDRELLELAAKAAGFEYNRVWFDEHTGLLVWEPPTTYESRDWNPITDDGDALRLAVKLRMCVDTGAMTRSNQTYVGGSGGYLADEKHGPDEYAATRRAIVRAAAEIGREIAQQTARADLPEDNYYKTMAEAEETGRTAAEIGRQMP